MDMKTNYHINSDMIKNKYLDNFFAQTEILKHVNIDQSPKNENYPSEDQFGEKLLTSSSQNVDESLHTLESEENIDNDFRENIESKEITSNENGEVKTICEYIDQS